MKTIPKQIQVVLDRLHAGGFPSAIVAGGAIRDYILGKPIKDIDVFVSYEDTDQFMFPSLVMANALNRDVLKEDWSTYMNIPDVLAVYSMTPYMELPVQIIVMKPGLSPVDRIDQLDFGICQVWYNGVTKKCTPAFSEDAVNKTITLVHCENLHEFERSMTRYVRLSQKYSEFELLIPEQFQQYLNWQEVAATLPLCMRTA